MSTIEAGSSLAAPSGRPGWWATGGRLLGAALLTLYLVVLPVTTAVNWLGLPDGDDSGRLNMDLSGSSAGVIGAKLGLALILAAGVSFWLTMSRLFERVPWPLIVLPVLAGTLATIFAPSWAWFLLTLAALRYVAFTSDGSPREIPFRYPPGTIVAPLVLALGFVPLGARALTHSVTADQIFAPSKWQRNVVFPLENHGAARAEVTLPDGRIAQLPSHSGSREFGVPASKLACGKRMDVVPLRYRVFGHTGTVEARFTSPAFVPCR